MHNNTEHFQCFKDSQCFMYSNPPSPNPSKQLLFYTSCSFGFMLPYQTNIFYLAICIKDSLMFLVV